MLVDNLEQANGPTLYFRKKHALWYEQRALLRAKSADHIPSSVPEARKNLA